MLILDVYLGLVNIAPTQFWKDHQYEYPTLARVARDVFSIPASGAGVERLFNSARDVCHYRRGRLNRSTIQDLMLFSCTTKFEIEEEQLELARKMGVHDEGETDDTSPETDNIEPISDREEDDDDEEVRLLSVRAGKRRRSTISEDENDQIGEDNNDDSDRLPIMQSQIRESGRVRKRPKGIEGFEVQFY